MDASLIDAISPSWLYLLVPAAPIFIGWIFLGLRISMKTQEHRKWLLTAASVLVLIGCAGLAGIILGIDPGTRQAKADFAQQLEQTYGATTSTPLGSIKKQLDHSGYADLPLDRSGVIFDSRLTIDDAGKIQISAVTSKALAPLN